MFDVSAGMMLMNRSILIFFACDAFQALATTCWEVWIHTVILLYQSLMRLVEVIFFV